MGSRPARLTFARTAKRFRKILGPLRSCLGPRSCSRSGFGWLGLRGELLFFCQVGKEQPFSVSREGSAVRTSKFLQRLSYRWLDMGYDLLGVCHSSLSNHPT